MSIAAARRYVELSNAAELDDALAMFREDATYESTQVGSFDGREAIGVMMRGFFANYCDAHWEVPTYAERGPGEVEFAFVMTATAVESGAQVVRRGTERVSFDTRGRIIRVHVMVPVVDLIVIAGAPGSGKTTIADLLHARTRSVLIDFGTFREFHLDPEWRNESRREEAMAFENLVFALRNYHRHGYRHVILTDLKERRVREIPELFADADCLIATLVVHDDAELARRVLIPDRDSGWRDVDGALAWNRAILDRPTLRGEVKIDNTAPDPLPALELILERLGMLS